MKCSIGDNISPRTAKGRFACEFLFKKIVLHMDTKAGREEGMAYIHYIHLHFPNN